ncbi:unnamed protein product, partial [Thlaspi arvense]
MVIQHGLLFSLDFSSDTVSLSCWSSCLSSRIRSSEVFFSEDTLASFEANHSTLKPARFTSANSLETLLSSSSLPFFVSAIGSPSLDIPVVKAFLNRSDSYKMPLVFPDSDNEEYVHLGGGEMYDRDDSDDEEHVLVE